MADFSLGYAYMTQFSIPYSKRKYLFEHILYRTNDEVIMVKRGDLYYADLSPVIGCEQGGIRPVLVVQNDIGNRYSPTVIAAAVTSRQTKTRLPTHIDLPQGLGGLEKDSVVLLEQIRTLDKRRLRDKIGELDEEQMQKVDQGLLISLGFYVQ